MNTAICRKLGLDVPIFAFTHCRDVVVAVSKAGGLGVLGAVGFVVEYVEHVPAYLRDGLEAARMVGREEEMATVIREATEYWLAEADIIPDRLGLLGVLDDAYYSLTLMQAVSDRYEEEVGRALFSRNLKAANASMRNLIGEMQLAIPAAFEGDDYRNQLRAIEEETKSKVEEQWKSLNERAAEEGIGVLQTPTGYVLAPIIDGKVIDDKEFNKLPEEKRGQIEAAIERLSEDLQARVEMMPKLRKAHRERVKALDQEVTAHAVNVQLADLKEKYSSLPRVAAYLDEVQENIIQNAQDFQPTETPSMPFLKGDSEQLYSQYEVNLVVDNAEADAAPVIYEANPSYPNIIGRVEHRSEMGALVTDFRLVRSGALLQANGGYLILDTRRVLSRPFVWEALKQALFARQVQIETPAESYGWVSTTTLKPEPIPLDTKVVLVGERLVHYLLSVLDPEFAEPLIDLLVRNRARRLAGRCPPGSGPPHRCSRTVPRSPRAPLLPSVRRQRPSAAP